MNSFAYVTAQTPESALDLVKGGGRFLAGGMDLLGEMKESLVEPTRLVNIKRLPGTTEIRPGSTWSIGANVTLATLASHPEVRRELPGLAEAAAEVGSPQIRNVATLGGNLAQHSRCWYYRHRDVHCRKKGGTLCYARSGENKYHSLFTGNMCLSPCTSNVAVALSALDARIVVQRGGKTEALPIADLYSTAWRTTGAHNSLRDSDLILRVELAPANRRSTYLQIAEKGDFDWALVSCAVAAEVSAGKIRNARIALGSVAPIPWQVDAANASLEGKPLTAESADDAAELLLKDARSYGQNGYKITIAKTLVRRALLKLA
jgi:xanthine dehydrogenase YagS FAD-binding subunit